jgi:hypothetical protein
MVKHIKKSQQQQLKYEGNPLYLYSFDPLKFILLTCKVFISSLNYQLSHHSSIVKSPLHHAT